MARNTQPKDEDRDNEAAHKATTINPTKTWINRTGTGRGFIIYCKEDYKEGDILLGGIQALQEFIDGERTGINLGKMVETEDKE